MRGRKVVVALVSALAWGCSPTPGVEADAGFGDGTEDAARGQDTGRDLGRGLEPERVLEARLPSREWIESRVEDPDFTFATTSWFPVDSSGALQRVARRFDARAPAGRPYLGVPGGATGSSCLLGRVRLGRQGAQRASVWVAGADSVEASVLAMRVSDARAAAQAYELELTGEVHEEGGVRTWRELAANVPASFGWGYLQVCHVGPSTSWVGAPLVVDVEASARALTSVSNGRQPTREELERVRSVQRASRAR